MLLKKKFLFFSVFFLIGNILFISFLGKKAKAATENDFSLNIHGFYNFGGNLFSDITKEDFWQYIDEKICELNGFSSLDSCRGKAKGTEIIKLSGKTGIIAKKIPDEQCQSGDSSPCFDASLNPPRTWASIDGPVRHATSLGMEIIMELNLLEKSTTAASPQIPIPYIRDKADVDHLLALGEKAIKRYDGNCDLNEDGDCNDNVEGTQEDPSIIYPKIKYWQVGNEPGNNKWTFQEKTLVDGKEVLLLAYATDQFAKKLKAHCPDCKIVLAGVGGDNRIPIYESFIYDRTPSATCSGNECIDVKGYYRKLIQDLKFLQNRDLGPANFDIFDFHHHHQQDINNTSWINIKPKYEIIRKLLDEEGFSSIPIWITETSSWTGTPAAEPWAPNLPYPNHSEEEQAAELIKRYVYPFFLGVKKVFWSPMIIDSPYGSNPNSYFANVGFIYKNGNKKLSFDTFRLLLSKIKDFKTIKRVDVDNPDVYLFKIIFTEESKLPIFIIWNENSSMQINLTEEIGPFANIFNLKGENTQETISNLQINQFPKIIEPFIPPCPQGNKGDINCDNLINEDDLEILIKAWAPAGPVIAPPEAKHNPDLNGDNKIDEADLTFILKNFQNYY